MSSLHWPPLPPDIIANPEITDRCFRAFTRLYAQAWNGTLLTPLRITESELSALLDKSRAQMYSLLAEMKSANLIRWHRDGRHFRITPNFQPPAPSSQGAPVQESQNPDSFISLSGNRDSFEGESGNPDSSLLPSLEIKTQSLESRIPRQVKKHGALKELIKFNDDESSEDQQHHHPSGESGFPDSATFEAVRAQTEDWLIRAGVWNDRAKKLAYVLAENELFHAEDAHLPTRVDILGWLVELKKRDDVKNLPAILAQNLNFGRSAPAKVRPPRICQTCQRAEGFCRCGLSAYHYPDALLDRALDMTASSWVCRECHALPCACPPISFLSTILQASALPIDELEPVQENPPSKVKVEIVDWDGVGMEPERAWGSALDQLQMQISKHVFEQWVKETHLVQWKPQAGAGLFTVACPDPLTRDWLTERLTKTLVNILVGVCNRQVEVKFVMVEE